jgi:hypothetical protein
VIIKEISMKKRKASKQIFAKFVYEDF